MDGPWKVLYTGFGSGEMGFAANENEGVQLCFVNKNIGWIASGATFLLHTTTGGN